MNIPRQYFNYLESKFEEEDTKLILSAVVAKKTNPPAFVIDINKLSDELVGKLVKCLEGVRCNAKGELIAQ